MNPQFWAEDGVIFFFQAHSYGARMIFEPYAGYLHLVQRLVAFTAAHADPLLAPGIFVGASLGLTLYVAARTQSSRMPFRPHLAFALAVALVPDAFEVLLFLVNIQWVLAGGLLLLLISADARRRAEYAHDGIAAVVLGLTGPFSVLFAPLFILRAFQRRTRASYLVASIVLACAGVQGWLIAHSPGIPPDTRVATETFLAIPGMRIGGSLLLGRWLGSDWPLLVETLMGLLTLGAAAALAFRGGRGRAERVWLALGLGLLLAATYFRCRNVLPGLCNPFFCGRYFFAPQLVFLWLLATLTDSSRRWVRIAVVTLLLGMLATNLPRLHEQPLVDQHWADYAARLRAGESVKVFINPTDWSFTTYARKP